MNAFTLKDNPAGPQCGNPPTSGWCSALIAPVPGSNRLLLILLSTRLLRYFHLFSFYLFVVKMPLKFELCPGRMIGGSNPCFIIAEIGQNHQGDIEIAKKMIKMAKV